MEKLQYYIHCLNLKFVIFTNSKLKIFKKKYSTRTLDRNQTTKQLKFKRPNFMYHNAKNKKTDDRIICGVYLICNYMLTLESGAYQVGIRGRFTIY